MKDDFEFLRGLANCQDKEQMARYIEEHQPKPMTNADRIRAMTDEELAQYLVAVESRRRGDGCGAIWGLPYVALEWLKQPAEVDQCT